MNESPTLERMVAAWMADEADATRPAAEPLTDQILSATGRQRPMPRWLALLQESPMRAQTQVAVGSPSYRLALAAFLVVAALVAAGVAAALLLTPKPAADDWPSFRGDASHAGIGQTGPIGSPVVRWTYHAAGSIRNNVAIAGELAFVASEDGVLHAIALTDGIERWSFQPGTSMTGPTTAAGLVIVTDGSNTVHALDASTGQERWRAADVLDGATSATVAGDRVYLASSNGRLVALEAASGAKRWDVPASINGDAATTPAVADGLVYTASQSGGLVALRADDGQVAWRADTAGDPVGTVVVAGGVAYVGANADDTPAGRLRAFDAKTGAPRWTIDEPLFSPTVAGSIAISGSTTGLISARDTATGNELWAFRADGTNRAPAVAGGVAYVAADGLRRIYALDVDDGRLLWQLDVDGENQCCIAVARGLVFAATMTGSVYAIGGDGVAIAPQQTPAASPTPAPTQATPSPTASPLPDPFSVVKSISAESLGLQSPSGIAVGPSGDVYVTDLSDRVTQLDPTGNVIRRWGGTGSEPGKFDFSPASASANAGASIAAGPDGSVYVSDLDNHRVQVFTRDGEFIRQFGSFGVEPGQFQVLFDLSADVDGNVYVLDDGLQRLTKFSPTGVPIWTADGETDPRLGGFKHTAAIDPEGRIVMVIDGADTVVYVSPDGKFVDSFAAGGCNSTVDPGGNVYVSPCPAAGTVTVFDRQHQAVAEGRSLSIRSPLFGPGDEVVALGDDGSVKFLKVTLPTP